MTIAIALALNAAVFLALSYITSKIAAAATYKRDVKRNLLIARSTFAIGLILALIAPWVAL